MRRAAALLAACVLVAGTARAISIPDARGGWNKAALPYELRGRVHMSAREVPRFPEDDPKLMHLEGWPAKRRIDGWDCELQVRKLSFDTREPTPRQDFSPMTSAYYLCRPRWWPWGKPQTLGPGYTWTSGGQLLERAYSRSRVDLVIYQVDRSGRLTGFIDRKHGITEYFDADGVLIAGEYAPVGLDKVLDGERREVVSVWLGDRVSHEEFMRRLSGLFRDMASRY